MKKCIIILVISLGSIIYAEDLPKPTQTSFKGTPVSIDEFMKAAYEAKELRKSRRITSETFLKYAADKGTIILDTRSKAKYDLRHVKGAKHLNFSDFTKESLAEMIPHKKTRILIYCNNNFMGDPRAFACKTIATALNIPTFINLYSYGYENVYELGSYESVLTTKIEFFESFK